ncbi:MAG: filamentous hemagglutinin N-terminal domain-containing protein [Cyanobacteria bacterium P01_F01_bin.143]
MASNVGKIKLLTVSFLTMFMGYEMPSLAQITPDGSLGAENSIVTPNVPLGNDTTNRIDGGAVRNNNIFHSFSEFNVNNGQQVHFANPTGIENIIGRVTGGNVSEILGTLGVLGDANLLLLNPDGFIFGQDAQLDINGSFTASSSESLFLGDNLEFSATNPQAVPLLTISVAPGLGDWLNPRGNIANQGSLNVGNDLTLIGSSLELEGQLQAGNDLTFQAFDSIQIRDRANFSFLATAGNQLLIQGDQLVDIFALNNTASGLIAGGDLVLRSHNPIITDAYFTSGGNFRIEDLNSNLGDAASPNDPIIRANGDVSLNNYTGASLHIFAGGSVNIDNIEITGADPNNGIEETVTLSDGVTTVAINGSTQPTLDIRAGTTNINPIGIQGNNQGFSSIPDTSNTANTADIQINQITNPGGLVFLTNQDQPNTLLSGNIEVGSVNLSSETDGGSVVLDSRGKINVAQQIEVSGFGGNGGNVQLIADGNIVIPIGANVLSSGLEGIGGNIILTSQSVIRATNLQSLTSGEGVGGNIKLTAPQILIEPPVMQGPDFIGVTLEAGSEGQGGNLDIEADYLEISGNNVGVATFGIGNSGNVSINAEQISIKNNSRILAAGVSPIGGNAGDIEIQTNDLNLADGSQISSSIFPGGIGDNGRIDINAKNSINVLDNFENIPSAIVTDIFPNATGNGGLIEIKTGSLTLQEGGQIRATTRGNGDAGGIVINAEDIILDGSVLPTSLVRGSAIVSEVLNPAIGNGNTIELNTEGLIVTNGGIISSATGGMGDAGNINITATELISFDGLFADENLAEPQPSGAFVGVIEGAIGNGGTLNITTPSLSVTNGAQLEALTEDNGTAGDINIFANDSVLLSGENTGLFSDTRETSTGDAGDINIFATPDVIEIFDSATISVESQGTGERGTITLTGENLTLDNQGRISANTASTDGGDISLNINELILLRRESNISTNAGSPGVGGDGGNITIDTGFIVAPTLEDNDITANAFEGNGGNVHITANGLFGIEFREQETPGSSDITASSIGALAGTVVINNPDVDPTSGLVQLPDETTDPSDRIIAGCAAVGGNSFTITGRGGLPEDPTVPIRGQELLSDLRDFSDVDNDADLPPVKTRSRQEFKGAIVQVQGWVVNQNGEVELVASSLQENSLLPPRGC